MPIDAIGAGIVGLPTLPTVGTAAAKPSGSAGFTDALGRAVQSLQEQHAGADLLAESGLTGSLADVHDYSIAATQAQLATELTVAVRNRALEAFTSIMTMPV
jgi:flagellar hook-basal body complex protein FliE